MSVELSQPRGLHLVLRSAHRLYGLLLLLESGRCLGNNLSLLLRAPPLLRTPFFRDHPNTTPTLPPPLPRAPFSWDINDSDFLCHLSGFVIVLLGSSSAGKRARFLMVIAFHYCFCWLRPRASVVALHLGCPRIDEGYIVRLLEVGAKVFLFFFFSCWCSRIVQIFTMDIHLV